MKILGIIPARFASTRFPGKPLADIKGKPMIQRVYEQCLKSKLLSTVVVATDDQKIADVVKGFGGKVIITATHHQSGTDRCAEVVELINEKYDFCINIQGDEPFIKPEQIDQLASFLSEKTPIVTLIKRIDNEEDIHNPNIVKVVSNINNKAMYFSRSTIPYLRNKDAFAIFFRHIGMYAYKTDILKEIALLGISELERAESLEQLRWLESGYDIYTIETPYDSIGIDTPEDLKKALNG